MRGAPVTRSRRWLWVGAMTSCLLVAGLGIFVVAGSAEGPDCSMGAGQGRIGGSDGADMLDMSDRDLAGALDAARDARMWSIRVDVDWSRVEPTAGTRDWSKVDRVVRAVGARGMCPLGLVTYAPAWAADPRLTPSGHYFAPRDPEAFAAFAKEAATRYRDQIGVWEVWNEPNTEKFFRPRPDAGAYGAMLAATYRAIKSVRPSLGVVSGGLAPAEDNGRDIAPTTFLTALYAGGFNTAFDAFGIHPYSYPALPDAVGTHSWNTAQRLGLMRDTMVAGGDAAKPIWITECGAPTGTAPVAVSDAAQAETIGMVLRTARATNWLGPAFVYAIRDSGTDAANPEQNFGILRHDLSRKPAYAVVSEWGKSHQ
jgi:polysaccharide biosynthesis protein PslG